MNTVLTSRELAKRTIARLVKSDISSDNDFYQRNSGNPVDWIEKNFYLYDTGEPMKLYDCQRRPLEEALTLDNGRFRYSTVLWSWPKKSAKSSVIAAVVDWLCSTRPRSLVRLVANDLKQADSRVGYYLRESIKFSAKDDPKRRDIKVKPSGYLIEYPNGSRVEMVPIDPNGEAGGNDDLIVYSELHGWKSTAHQRMWAEMTLSPTKGGKAQRWIDTYAGYEGESPILENLYRLGVKEGRLLWDDHEVYANDIASLLCVWVTRHLLPWQLNEDGRAYYASEAAQLVPNEYRRMHGNEWVSSSGIYLPIEWWHSCKGALPDFDANAPVVIGMDAGISSDYFALVGVSRIGELVYVRFVFVWKPPKGGTIDFSEVEREIRELVKRYNVVQIAYDAHELHDMSTRLTRDGIAWMYRFSQGQDRLVADKSLYDAIRDRRVVHDGDQELTDCIRNANGEIDKRDHSLRIVKRADHLKIDAAVALSMANHEVRRLNI